MRGLLIACAKRPIAPEQLGALIDSIEAELRNASKNEIGSKELGDMALVRLAKLVLNGISMYLMYPIVLEMLQSGQYGEAAGSLGAATSAGTSAWG